MRQHSPRCVRPTTRDRMREVIRSLIRRAVTCQREIDRLEMRRCWFAAAERERLDDLAWNRTEADNALDELVDLIIPETLARGL